MLHENTTNPLKHQSLFALLLSSTRGDHGVQKYYIRSLVTFPSQVSAELRSAVSRARTPYRVVLILRCSGNRADGGGVLNSMPAVLVSFRALHSEETTRRIIDDVDLPPLTVDRKNIATLHVV